LWDRTIWVDKLQTTNQYLYFPDVKRWQYLYPPFSNSARALTVSERITPDKWQPATNQPVFDAKRQQQTYPATGAYTRNPVTEIVTTDKWHPITNQPVFDVKRWQHLYQTWATDAKHLLDKETIIVAKWFRETQQPLFDVKRWQFLYPYLSIDTQFFIKPPFYRDKYTPKGNSFSDKFSSQGTSYSDKYSAKG
jgi:hypothetical protein